MLSLKDNCVRPGTGKPYIVSLTGGTSVSIEGMEVSSFSSSFFSSPLFVFRGYLLLVNGLTKVLSLGRHAIRICSSI